MFIASLETCDLSLGGLTPNLASVAFRMFMRDRGDQTKGEGKKTECADGRVMHPTGKWGMGVAFRVGPLGRRARPFSFQGLSSDVG